MHVLCVGGSNDGKRVEIPDGKMDFSLTVPSPLESWVGKTEFYVIEKFVAGKLVAYVARPVNMSIEQVMTLVFEKYPQPELERVR